jgi:choline transport protein
MLSLTWQKSFQTLNGICRGLLPRKLFWGLSVRFLAHPAIRYTLTSSLAGFVYAIAILYGISDLNSVVSSNGSFPLAAVYAQATNGNNGATFGLLFIIFTSLMICVIGTVLTIARIWWTLARDNATPFAHFFSIVDEKLSCPIPATLFCAIFGTGLGAIPLGSKTAFQDLVGSFITLSTMSFVLAILPNILTRRKNIPPGPFYMGRLGMPVNIAAVVLICFFNVFYCFRKSAYYVRGVL